MQLFVKLVVRLPPIPLRKALTRPHHRALALSRGLGTSSQDREMGELVAHIDSLKNYEKLGVPKGAGTDTDDGFDLGRIRRLLARLGNPQSKFKVRTFPRVSVLLN